MILPKESATFFKLPIQLFKGVSYPELALFVYESSDQNYFRIILPNIFKVEDDIIRYDSLVNNINQRYKVAKVTLTQEGMVWISAEQFVYSREGIDYLFERCLAALRGAVEYIKEQQSKLSHD